MSDLDSFVKNILISTIEGNIKWDSLQGFDEDNISGAFVTTSGLAEDTEFFLFDVGKEDLPSFLLVVKRKGEISDLLRSSKMQDKTVLSDLYERAKESTRLKDIKSALAFIKSQIKTDAESLTDPPSEIKTEKL